VDQLLRSHLLPLEDKLQEFHQQLTSPKSENSPPGNLRRFDLTYMPDFVRRANLNGSIDSICTKCYVTVATATLDADLDSAEPRHQCDSWRLEYYKKLVERVDSFEQPKKRSGAA